MTEMLTTPFPEIANESRILELQERYSRFFAEVGFNSHAKPVIVNGVHYRSALEAYAATGIPSKTIQEACNGIPRKRLDKVTKKLVEFTARYA